MSTILVTGATDGLVRALAHDLAACGHEVAVRGRSRERAESVAHDIGGTEVVVADFARLDDVRALADQAPGVDVLVNNAGIIARLRRLRRLRPEQARPDHVHLELAVQPATLMDTKMVRECRADPVAYDADARRRLWDVSAELTSAPPLAR